MRSTRYDRAVLWLGAILAIAAVPLWAAYGWQLPFWSAGWWFAVVVCEGFIGVSALGIRYGTQDSKFWT